MLEIEMFAAYCKFTSKPVTGYQLKKSIKRVLLRSSAAMSRGLFS